jgi:hypothetical protein
MLFTIPGSKTTAVIYMGDLWKPKNLVDSRYLWMPVTIGNGRMHLPPPTPWKINVKTGNITIARSARAQ